MAIWSKYFSRFFCREHKGVGDKKDKYPYEGKFVRESGKNKINRYVHPESPAYKKFLKNTGENSISSASSHRRNTNQDSYGISSTKYVGEPILDLDLLSNVKIKNVEKDELNLTPKTPNTPILPTSVRSNPTTPKIILSDDPALPPLPTFKVIVGADCSGLQSCPEDATPDNPTGARSREIKGTKGKDGYEYLHYTWKGSRERQGLAFKFFDLTGDADWVNFDGYVYGSGKPMASDINNPLENMTFILDGEKYTKIRSKNYDKEISINSYNNFHPEAEHSENTFPVDRNKQYFLVGGSRAIEFDTVERRNHRMSIIANVGQINLGGILSLGMVTQTSSKRPLNQNLGIDEGFHIVNEGIITDVKEKDDAYIQDLKNHYDTDTNGDGVNDSLKIHGPFTQVYDVKLSEDGYTGYKVGMAIVPENTPTDYTILANNGEIDFKGYNSIGMYIYLPSTSKLGSLDTAFYGNFINRGSINLSGKESYGMKLAGRSGVGAQFTNEGKINLKRNKKDKADLSAGMALMEDDTVVLNSHIFPEGKALNKGTITLTDVKNSLGTYINIASDITNDVTGKININSTIEKETAGQQAVNIGMRADGNANSKVINKGRISLDGSYAMGMLAKGSKLVNQGTVTTGTDIKNGTGLMALAGANIENSGTVKVKGSGRTNNIGVILKGASIGTVGTKLVTDPPAQEIEVSGDNSTGVIVAEASKLTLGGNVSASGNAVSGIVVEGVNSEVILDGAGTVKVDNNGNFAGIATIDGKEKGSYAIIVDGANAKFEGKDTVVNAKLTSDKSVGLYASSGTLTVKEANVETENGAVNFGYLSNSVDKKV